MSAREVRQDAGSADRRRPDTLAAEGIEAHGLAGAEDALVLPRSGQVLDVLVADIDLGAGLSGLDLAALAEAIRDAAAAADEGAT